MTSTCAEVWTSKLMLLIPRHHHLGIWGSQSSTCWIKAVSLVILLPVFEERRMDPIRARQIMFLVKWVRKSLAMIITIKLVFKFGAEIRNLSAKQFRINSYWRNPNKRKNVTFGLDSCWYKTPDPKPLTRPTESSKRNGKDYVPDDWESEPSLLDSLSSKYDSSDDSKYRKSKSKRDTIKRKKRRKHT